MGKSLHCSQATVASSPTRTTCALKKLDLRSRRGIPGDLCSHKSAIFLTHSLRQRELTFKQTYIRTLMIT